MEHVHDKYRLWHSSRSHVNFNKCNTYAACATASHTLGLASTPAMRMQAQPTTMMSLAGLFMQVSELPGWKCAHLGLHVARERLHGPQCLGELAGGGQLKHNPLLRLLHAVCLAAQWSATLRLHGKMYWNLKSTLLSMKTRAW